MEFWRCNYSKLVDELKKLKERIISCSSLELEKSVG